MPANAELICSHQEIEPKQTERLIFSDFSLVLIKPDAFRQCLENIIIHRIEREGLIVVKRKILRLREDQVDALYPNVKDEFFYEDMKAFLMSEHVMALIIGGNGGVDVTKELLRIKGHSYEPGTIRGDLYYKEWVGPEDYALWEKGIHPKQTEITMQVVARNRIHSLSCRELAYQGITALFDKDELEEIAHRVGGFKEFLNDCAH